MSGGDTMQLREERDGAVLVLTLDYPARRNALAMPLRTAMLEALERAIGDRRVRAVVLTGGGGHFCSGGDISGMDVPDALAGRERMRRSHQLVRLMVMGQLPIVAAVEGFCVGAGLSLACACDRTPCPRALARGGRGRSCSITTSSPPRRPSASAWSTMSCRRGTPWRPRWRRRASWPSRRRRRWR